MAEWVRAEGGRGGREGGSERARERGEGGREGGGGRVDEGNERGRDNGGSETGQFDHFLPIW